MALAKCGIASRRKSAEIIQKGRVSVNGLVIKERGHAVDPYRDTITVDGKPAIPRKRLYLLLNKPRGYITTLSDERGRRSIADLIPPQYKGVYPVGRLDKDTAGLLVLTNDGELAFKLSHPSFGVVKRYRALCEGHLADKERRVLEKGLFLDGRKTARCKISVLKASDRETSLMIEIHEGRKHQVKLMLLYMGHPVRRLERIGYASLSLNGLQEGRFRHLRPDEVARLRGL